MRDDRIDYESQRALVDDDEDAPGSSAEDTGVSIIAVNETAVQLYRQDENDAENGLVKRW